MNLKSARFEVQGCLGAGAFGTVYRAFDRERRIPVALKVLHDAGGEALQRFKAEFRALADITHPNLIAIYDMLFDEGQWFFSMELIEGVSFLRYVRADEACDEDRLREGACQLAAGLHALHQHQVLHRDVKPSNVLVTSRGRVVLLDFGLSTPLRAGQADTDDLAGTPLYMSPEQAAGDLLSPASDWYAVGVLLYECLHGQPPHHDKGYYELLDSKRAVKSQEIRTELSPHALDLVMLAGELLRADPARRPTGADVVRRLGGVPGSDGVHVPVIHRPHHRDVLQQSLADAREHGVVVSIQGPSGIGKSMLVSEFLADLSADAALVLSGRCYEQEEVPYKAFDAIVDRLAEWLDLLPPSERQACLPDEMGALARMFPVLMKLPGVTPTEASREAGAAALRQCLARLSQMRPLVMFIDDLQWSDEESLFLLERVAGVPGALMILAARAGEMPALSCAMQTLQVEPLSADESRALARQLLGRVHATLQMLVLEARGHPYLLTEIVRASEHVATWSGFTLDGVLRLRIEKLAEKARHLLEVLAVAGHPLDREIALEVAQAPPHVVAVLRSEHLIRRVAGTNRLVTYHDRLRETVVRTLSEAAQADLHRRLAEALAHCPDADVETLVRHWREAGETARAAALIPIAAAQAESSMAFERAARLYGMLPPGSSLRARIKQALNRFSRRVTGG